MSDNDRYESNTRWFRCLGRGFIGSKERDADRLDRGLSQQYSLEPLESRLLLSITVDVSTILPDGTNQDAAGFFTTHSEALVTFRAAANDLVSRLDDTLTAITPGSGGGSWSATIEDPTTNATKSIADLAVPANTLLIFVGGTTYAGTQIAHAQTGFSYSGNTTWNDNVVGRGQANAVAGAGTSNPSGKATDVAPWGGSILFDMDPNIDWYFGTNPNPYDATTNPTGIKPGQISFYTVAQHELGHILGINSGTDATGVFMSKVTDGNFTGANAVAIYGGNVPVAPGGGHWQNNLPNAGTFQDGYAVMDPSQDNPATELGHRNAFTELDYAALKDIGWQVSAKPVITAPPPPGGNGGPGAPPNTRLITVNITSFIQRSTPDNGIDDDGEYFARVSINGGAFQQIPTSPDDFVDSTGNDDEITVTGWTFTAYVPNDLNLVNVTIQLWDDDDFLNGDIDLVDIDPTEGNKNLELVLDLKNETFTGDATGTFESGEATGNGDDDDGKATIKFNFKNTVSTKSQSLVVDGGGVLTVQGDQFGPQDGTFNDTITFDAGAGGGLKVTVNGVVQEYAPGQITSIIANTGFGSNTVTVLAPIVPLTINGGGYDKLVLGGTLPAATYTPDANGLPGYGTLNAGDTQIQFKSVEFVDNVAPELTGISISSATIDENGIATITGTFKDPGSYSTQMLSVDWGDGTTYPATLVFGANTFTVSHRYLDDSPCGTPSDAYTITL
ncbi:MAG: hypothetical protein AB7J13_16460, partial [Pyrinomonadaceae bacterium]